MKRRRMKRRRMKTSRGVYGLLPLLIKLGRRDERAA